MSKEHKNTENGKNERKNEQAGNAKNERTKNLVQKLPKTGDSWVGLLVNASRGPLDTARRVTHSIWGNGMAQPTDVSPHVNPLRGRRI